MRVQNPQSEFTPCPEGVQQAVVVDIEDLGWREKTFQGESKGFAPCVRLVFQSALQMDGGESPGKPFLVRDYPLFVSWHEKANWRGRLVGIFGSAAVEQIIKTGQFEPDWLIGRNVQMVIKHSQSTKDGQTRTYANIENIIPWPEQFGAPIAPQDYTRKKDDPSQPYPEPSAFADIEPEQARRMLMEAAGQQRLPDAPPVPTPQPSAYPSTAPLPASTHQAAAVMNPAMNAAGGTGSFATEAQINAVLGYARRVWDRNADIELPLMLGKQVDQLTKSEASTAIDRLRHMADLPGATWSNQSPVAPAPAVPAPMPAAAPIPTPAPVATPADYRPEGLAMPTGNEQQRQYAAQLAKGQIPATTTPALAAPSSQNYQAPDGNEPDPFADEGEPGFIGDQSPQEIGRLLNGPLQPVSSYGTI